MCHIPDIKATFLAQRSSSSMIKRLFISHGISGSPWTVLVSGNTAMTVLGETVKLVPAGTGAAFHLAAPGFTKSDFDVQVTGKEDVTSYLPLFLTNYLERG